MIEVRTRSHAKDKSFALNWYGTIGGAALPVDSNPTNLASVSAARILRVTAKRDGIIAMACPILRVAIADGTSLTIRPWYYDDTQAVWIPLFIATTVLTAATSNSTTLSVSNICGARVYFQVTANSGNVSALGYELV